MSEPSVSVGQDVPPLVDGERLSRAEFERRYAAMPDLKKAELIGGVVRVASPTRQRHGRPHVVLAACLCTYDAATPGVEAIDNTTMRLGEDDELQPDVALRLVRGGTSRVDDEGYIAGPVELAAEVSLSSLPHDLNAKRRAYERHGCREYVVVAVPEGRLRCFLLEDGALRPRDPGPDGILRSGVFPGLWLDGSALARGDAARALDAVRAGLASPEHAVFVRALAGA